MISYKSKFFVHGSDKQALAILENDVNVYLADMVVTGWTLHTMKVLTTMTVVVLRKEVRAYD